MKGAYLTTIIKNPDRTGKSDYEYVAHVPSFNIYTEGKDFIGVIDAVRDAVGLMGIQYQDSDLEFPDSLKEETDEDFICNDAITTYVDIDFDAYRKRDRLVKKNCTIPYYLNVKAEEKGINFSKTLQEALLVKLGLN